MSKVVFALTLSSALMGSGGVAATLSTFNESNPFFSASDLAFQAPAFDRIKDADYQPAIEAGMSQQLDEIEAIVNNPSSPTFENTFLPLERSGRLLQRASAAFTCVSQANTNPTLQAVKSVLAPKFASHHDAIYLNKTLFARVAILYRDRDHLPLDPESRRLVEVTYDEFVRSGASLSDADKTSLKKLNEEASALSDAFIAKVLAATERAAFTTANREDLAGLSSAQLAAAAQMAHARKVKGYTLALQNTTQQPDLGSLRSRVTRHAIFERSWDRAELGDANDTRSTIARLAQLRAQRAALLGFKNHAAWTLADQMAKTPAAAMDFMSAIIPLAKTKAAYEQAAIEQLSAGESNGRFTLEPWDWSFFANRVRKAKYSLDDDQTKPYFELTNVLINGVFFAANRLYGITFKERHDIPVYHPDVRVFDVIDTDGKPLALFYCDYFKRDNKNGGAWMSNLVDQSQLLATKPVIYNIANFAKPVAGQPALISYDDVTTMFHEFGHALHGMFADTQYPSLSGTATPRDFVEFPSQFNEHWAMYPEIFSHYATHYKTGAVMPEELSRKIMRTENFDEGYKLTELLAAAELDMQWHTLGADAPLQNPDEFEQRALTRVHLDGRNIPPRYRSSYFSHIWGGEYSAGYYAYLWTQMLGDDAYQWFDDHGGITRANGDRLRQMILSRGNTQELGSMYEAWRGKPPSVDAMMKYRGLKDATAPPL